jgi:hypothetical protein
LLKFVSADCGVLQARKDWYFIAMPNAMGVAFNTVSLLLCVVFPAREREVEAGLATSQPSALRRLLQSFGGKSSTQAAETAVPVREADMTVDMGPGSVHLHDK